MFNVNELKLVLFNMKGLFFNYDYIYVIIYKLDFLVWVSFY